MPGGERGTACLMPEGLMLAGVPRGILALDVQHHGPLMLLGGNIEAREPIPSDEVDGPGPTNAPALVSSPYTITESLCQGGSAILFRAIRSIDCCPVILKVLDRRRSRPKDLERLRHEYEIGTQASSSAIVRPLALETYEGMPALVLEDFGGRSLDELLGVPMAAERFLPLAIGIAKAVADVHQQGIVHRDLKPSNIILNLTTGEVKIADFGLASRLPREQQPAQPPRLIEGSLPYLSPEQTGRMNRAIDNRADLYSLGVTFYQMLTARLPFEAKDPVEWVHCHVARAPPSPTQIVPGIPDPMACIVRKLLSKMPEDRYQSARGLQHDLTRCLAEWSERGRIEPFALAEHDATGGLQLPQKPHGREVEIGLLYEVFGRVVKTGTPEILLVSGYSGIGKSTLVRELDKPIVRERAFFLSGKFDQYKRDIPYATLVQAFRELALEILAESEARIAEWKQRLLDALGSNGQLIIEVIPPIELVIGRQPPVPELPPAEAQNRFRMLLRRFIGVFAQREHPLVLFLDDLQWVDSASIGLLEELLTHSEMRHFLVIGAYRDNEVTPSHPLMLVLAEVRKAGGRVSEIVLGPIRPEHLASFVSEALRCRVEDSAPLVELIYDKTAGNPFFAIQFLLSLHEERLIAFDERARTWRWDVAQIRAKNFTDNVVDLMIGKLRRLPAATQSALAHLACLGNAAEVTVLTMVHGRPEEDVHTDLWEAVRAGLVLRVGHTYKFVHDRVQEAAYSQIPEELRAAENLRVGRLLLAHGLDEARGENVFDIVSHFNRGAALLESQDEKLRVAELNLLAARKAKAATAYASALGYLSAGQALLSPDSWNTQYAVTYGLYIERAQCEWLCGHFESAADLLAVLMARARSRVDRLTVYRIEIELHTARGEIEQSALATLAACSDLFDLTLPLHPTREELRGTARRVRQELGARAIEDLIHLPAMTDPDVQAEVALLSASLPSAGSLDSNLHDVICCEIVSLSLRHGNTSGSPHGYVTFGATLGRMFEEWGEAHRFGKLAHDLVEKPGFAGSKASTYFTIGIFIEYWVHHVRDVPPVLHKAFRSAIEQGDINHACYALCALLICRITMGDPLAEVAADADKYLAFTQDAQYDAAHDTIVGIYRLVKALREKCPDPSSYDAPGPEQAQVMTGLTVARSFVHPGMYYTYKTAAQFLFLDHEEAALASVKAREFIVMAWAPEAECYYWTALALAAHHDHATPDRQKEYLATLIAYQEQFRVWQEHGPQTFLNRYALLSAEIARIEHRELDAMHLYEEAIRSARENGFVQNEAIAYERGARFYRARGFDQIADVYLRDARACYARWGADGKVKQLDQQNPHLVEPRSLSPTTTVAVHTEQLDLYSVTKASQTISGEIVLDKLVRTLLEVALEQGGAERGYLILSRDGSLSIEAEAAIEEGGVATSILGSLPVDASPRVPASLVHYAQRTKERVILSDASAHAGKFAGDDYFTRVRPQSVLCLPIVRQAEVVGLLYLENNLVAGAFTSERLVALSLLATQAAISLENALLLAEERTARAAAEDAERRAAFLAEAGAVLSESLDYQETFTRLGRLCVHALADWCTIDVVEGREFQRLAVAHADPTKEAALKELQRRYPPRWGSRHPASTVIRTGEPLLMPELPDEVLRAMCIDDEHFRLLRELGTQTGISVPLVARGQMLGALTLSSGAQGHRLGRADLELAEDVARRAAIAIDNARLYRASQEAVRARSEFLTVASHELNTPMTSLVLAVQSLRQAAPSGRPIDPQAMERMLELVSRQAARLTRLTDDLLDVSRLEAGPPALEVTDVDLGALVREVVVRFEVDLAHSRCSVAIRAGTPVVGRWDRSRIDRVVTNLLSNAIKFGAGEPIEIFLGVEGGIARLAVRDHGIGIAPDQRDRIFGCFERAVSERHYGGLGLGLYISRKIVEDHGGSIRCESRPGAGSTFTVELPLSLPS